MDGRPLYHSFSPVNGIHRLKLRSPFRDWDDWDFFRFQCLRALLNFSQGISNPWPIRWLTEN